MQIIHSISQLRQTINTLKKSGKVIAFVPTMGNLHQGHLQLVEKGLKEADIVVCSIFVNPLQFGEGEDFERYPKTLEADAERLEQLGCDIIFAPSVEEMYPDSSGHGRDQSQVVVPGLSEILEGASRPGHFTGVATIVAKLFNMVQPDKAIFGEKDYQQLLVIKRFVKDLCFPVEIHSHPIVREANGLAMSSRNGYLTQEQRNQAAIIHQTLQDIGKQLKSGERNYELMAQQATEILNKHGFKTDYIKIKNTDLSEPDEQSSELVILVAAYLGTTRLIDNICLTF